MKVKVPPAPGTRGRPHDEAGELMSRVMSRTRLSLLVALLLTAASAGVYFARRAALGAEAEGPAGVAAWEVTVTVRGELTNGDTTVTTYAPPDFRRQHVYEERWKSGELTRREGREKGRGPAERATAWKRPPMAGGPTTYRL